jgi:hypothetical protein
MNAILVNTARTVSLALGTCSPPYETDTSSVLENVKAACSASLIYVKPYAGRASQKASFLGASDPAQIVIGPQLPAKLTHPHTQSRRGRFKWIAHHCKAAPPPILRA